MFASGAFMDEVTVAHLPSGTHLHAPLGMKTLCSSRVDSTIRQIVLSPRARSTLGPCDLTELPLVVVRTDSSALYMFHLLPPLTRREWRKRRATPTSTRSPHDHAPRDEWSLVSLDCVPTGAAAPSAAVSSSVLHACINPHLPLEVGWLNRGGVVRLWNAENSEHQSNDLFAVGDWKDGDQTSAPLFQRRLCDFAAHSYYEPSSASSASASAPIFSVPAALSASAASTVPSSLATARLITNKLNAASSSSAAAASHPAPAMNWSWARMEFSSAHARALLLALPNELLCVDTRAPAPSASAARGFARRGVTLHIPFMSSNSAPASASAAAGGVPDRWWALSTSHLQRFEFALTSTHHVYLMDERYTRVPLLQWAHHLSDAPPTYVRFHSLRSAVLHPATTAGAASPPRINCLLTGNTLGDVVLYRYRYPSEPPAHSYVSPDPEGIAQLSLFTPPSHSAAGTSASSVPLRLTPMATHQPLSVASLRTAAAVPSAPATAAAAPTASNKGLSLAGLELLSETPFIQPTLPPSTAAAPGSVAASPAISSSGSSAAAHLPPTPSGSASRQTSSPAVVWPRLHVLQLTQFGDVAVASFLQRTSLAPPAPPPSPASFPRPSPAPSPLAVAASPAATTSLSAATTHVAALPAASRALTDSHGNTFSLLPSHFLSIHFSL